MKDFSPLKVWAKKHGSALHMAKYSTCEKSNFLNTWKYAFQSLHLWKYNVSI